MLTQARLRELLHYDPLTGLFTWLVKGSIRTPKGSLAGTRNTLGYVVFRVDGPLHYAHRLAWLYMTGEFPPAGLDHRDGDPGNNVWTNLRPATQGQNNQNLPRCRRGKSLPIGVVFNAKRQKHQARIQVDNKRIDLGFYDDSKTARAVYLAAKQHFHTFNPVPREA